MQAQLAHGGGNVGRKFAHARLLRRMRQRDERCTIWTRHDVAYLGVLVWAFVGIAVKHADTAPIALAAGLSAAVVALLAIYAAWAR